jgi:hypothetical protein
VPKRTKKAKKTCIEIPILRTTSGGSAEKYNRSAEREIIGAETTKIQSAKKSAETGGNRFVLPKKRTQLKASKRISPSLVVQYEKRDIFFLI